MIKNRQTFVRMAVWSLPQEMLVVFFRFKLSTEVGVHLSVRKTQFLDHEDFLSD